MVFAIILLAYASSRLPIQTPNRNKWGVRTFRTCSPLVATTQREEEQRSSGHHDLQCTELSRCTQAIERSAREHISSIEGLLNRSFTMGWPYHFLDLTPDEKSHRQELLSQYAFISQLSVLIPIFGYGIYRLCAWLFVRKGAFDVAYSALRELPGSTESTRKSKGVSFKAIARRWRALQWWLNGEIAPNWGLRGRWIAAIVCTIWLLVLCFVQTGHGKLSPFVLRWRS